MAKDIIITEAQLSGNFCETLSYGIYIVTCGFCARTLLLTGREERWRRMNEIRWFMVGVAVSLFFINSFDVAIGLYHNIAAFVHYTGPDGPAGKLTNISSWVNIARSCNQVVQMIIGDFVLIYRCWVIYGRRWKVIVPSSILYLIGIAMALKLIHVEATLSNKKVTLNSGPIRPWWCSFFAGTAVQNTLTTALMVWRIWRVERQNELFRASRTGNSGVSPGASQPRLRKVIRVIAESGAAYTFFVSATFIVSVANSNLLYPLSDITIQATGIAFNVIIIRSTIRRDEEFTIFDHNERTITEMDAPESGPPRRPGEHSIHFTGLKQGKMNSAATARTETVELKSIILEDGSSAATKTVELPEMLKSVDLKDDQSMRNDDEKRDPRVL